MITVQLSNHVFSLQVLPVDLVPLKRICDPQELDTWGHLPGELWFAVLTLWWVEARAGSTLTDLCPKP